MGYRITKQIGYYLNDTVAKKIIRDDYQEILEALDYDDNGEIKKFQKELNRLITNYSIESKMKDDIHDVLMKITLSQTSKVSSPLDMIINLYNFDEEHGFLFVTPNFLKAKRFDDLIDYYENIDNYNFQAKLLNSAIYPVNGWIYSKEIDEYVPEDFKEEISKFKVGDVINSENMNWLMNRYYSNVAEKTVDYLINIRKTTFFHPNVEPLAYLIAKASGILRDDVDEFMFRTTVEPAIVSKWG